MIPMKTRNVQPLYTSTRTCCERVSVDEGPCDSPPLPPQFTLVLTCLTGLMRQPLSAVSAARGLDRHLFFDVAAMWSSCGIVIGRHHFGSTAGVEPSGLQHSSATPFSADTRRVCYYYYYYQSRSCANQRTGQGKINARPHPLSRSN